MKLLQYSLIILTLASLCSCIVYDPLMPVEPTVFYPPYTYRYVPYSYSNYYRQSFYSGPIVGSYGSYRYNSYCTPHHNHSSSHHHSGHHKH